MKTLHSILFLFFGILLSALSCECDDIRCDSYDINQTSWLNYNVSENISFSDSTSSNITLTIDERSFSEPFFEAVEWKAGTGCNQRSDICNSEAIVRGQFSPSINGYSNYYMRISSQERAEILGMEIIIYDFNDRIIIEPKIELRNSRQKFHNNITLNGTNYTDVISMEIDTNNIGNLNKHIWKVYYSEAEGIIAFADKIDDKTYYSNP